VGVEVLVLWFCSQYNPQYVIFHEETDDSRKVLFPLSLSLHKPTAGACPEPDNIVMWWGSTVLALLGQYDFN